MTILGWLEMRRCAAASRSGVPIAGPSNRRNNDIKNSLCRLAGALSRIPAATVADLRQAAKGLADQAA
jgi:hypothetical protein